MWKWLASFLWQHIWECIRNLVLAIVQEHKNDVLTKLNEYVKYADMEQRLQALEVEIMKLRKSQAKEITKEIFEDKNAKHN